MQSTSQLTSPSVPIVFPFGTPLGSPIKPAIKVQIRWLIRRDMPEVVDIERDSFEFAWSEEDFLCCLRQRNCIGMVAECNHRVVGFMVYELHKSKLHVLNFAVDPEFRRQEVGAAMVEKLVDKLSQQRRQEIIIEVRETNLGAQLFFRKMGFKAVLVLRGRYDDTDEDAYVMRYGMREEIPSFLITGVGEPAERNAYGGRMNRISQFYAHDAA